MHGTKRNSLILSLIGMFMLLIFSGVEAQGEPVFRIGVLDNERGAISNGARLAVQEINNAGGVRGADGTFFRLELVIQPTNFGDGLQTAVVTLDQAGVVAVLGPETDEVVLNGVTPLQSLGVPVLTPATGDTILTADTTGLLFRTRAAEVYQGRALADYLVNVLNTTQITTVQLDVPSTAGMVGFSTAVEALGVTPGPALLLEAGMDVPALSVQIIQTAPEVLVTYGAPTLASELYMSLRTAGWQGTFVYPQAQDPIFTSAVPLAQLNGIISVTTWPFTAVDPASAAFLTNFVRAYGEVPHEVEAASYDAVQLLAAAMGQPGDLRTNLAALDNVVGVQGILRPAHLGRGDTSTNVAVVELGQFGAPVVLARYRDGERLPPDTPGTPTVVTVPATATPAGVTVTITGLRQNVRTGPSIDYPVIGQLNRGEQARVIGTTVDKTWVIIDFRAQQGWLATYLLDVFGDLNTVPIIQPPPLPTPVVTPTPIPPPEADLVTDTATVPQPILPNNPFVATVVVRNAGNTPAGQFTVAATFPPNNVLTSAVVAGLPPGQSITVNLQGTLTNTGQYTAGVIVDANNQVPEGAGEGNNTYNLSYRVDVLVLREGSQTLNLGDTLDLEGNAVQGDANWNNDGGLGLDAIFGARVGVLPGTDINQIHWDLINPTVINRDTIPRTEMNPGTLIGIITADGHRGVMRVEGVNDTQITLTFRVYLT
jgi:branched-chain amino acid transport system substrate-binding protein